MKKLLFLIVFIAPSWVCAQLHKNLDSIEVFAKTSVADVQVQHVDSIVLQFLGTENLGDVLQKHSGINVNANGFFGQVSSPSSGGLGSDHVKVHWEGVELNQLTLGSFDLSLFPTFLADGVIVNSGSDFNTLGGNASGLGVNIQSNASQGNELGFGFGSFGYHQARVKVSERVGAIQFTMQPYIISSENDFRYEEKLPREVVEKVSEHNALQQVGFMMNAIIGEKLKTGVWAQNRQKQLPNILQENGAPAALQLDRNYRAFMRFNPSNHWEWQLDYSNDQLQYRDKLGREIDYSINSKIDIQRLGNHLRYRYYVKHFKIQAQSQILYYSINSSGFSKRVNQWRSQNQLSVEFKKSGWYGKLASKLLSIEGEDLRNTVMASVGYSFGKTTLSYGINQRFKAPDFNDLFWANGGNPDLKNEEGWSHYALLHHKGRWISELKMTHIQLKNKIQWIPNGNNWSPINIYQMRSLSMDVRVGRKWTKDFGRFGFNVFANHTTANEMNGETGEFKAEQVIYLPRYKVGVNGSVNNKKCGVSISAYGMDKRFTDRDNQEIFALLPYYSVDAGISRQLFLGNTLSMLQLQVSNVLNNTELLTLSRPNPGRYYRLTLSFKF
jgi:iron complex outermembrane receptor protein